MHDTTKSKSTKKSYSSSNNFYVKKYSLEIQKRAFSRVGAKICSEIAASLREPPPPPPPKKDTSTRNSTLSYTIILLSQIYTSYESVGRKKQ